MLGTAKQKILATGVLAVIGSIIIAFGPVLMDHALKYFSPADPMLEQNKSVLDALNRTLSVLEAQQQSTGQAPSQQSAPAAADPVPVAAASSPIENSSTKAAKDSGVLPPVLPRTVSVFENEQFNLCGFQSFSARLPNSSSVVISSPDRAIPDRVFRGYEKSLPLNTSVDLWQNCTVAVAVQRTAGSPRIVFSYARREE